MEMYRIVTRHVKPVADIQLQVARSIREFARPLVPIARQIVAGLREAAGVSDVAYGPWLSRGRTGKQLLASFLPEATRGYVIVHVKADPYLHARCWWQECGRYGDVPGADMSALIDQMRNVRVPYDCVPYGAENPDDWQVPHLWPGYYLPPKPWDPDYLLDPVSGISSSELEYITSIWRTAPLALYAAERFFIPLDVLVKQEISFPYRRIAGNLYFLVPPGLYDQGTGRIQRVLDPLHIDYYIRNVVDYRPGMELPVA